MEGKWGGCHWEIDGFNTMRREHPGRECGERRESKETWTPPPAPETLRGLDEEQELAKEPRLIGKVAETPK